MPLEVGGESELCISLEVGASLQFVHLFGGRAAPNPVK